MRFSPQIYNDVKVFAALGTIFQPGQIRNFQCADQPDDDGNGNRIVRTTTQLTTITRSTTPLARTTTTTSPKPKTTTRTSPQTTITTTLLKGIYLN